ncbi:phosphocholine cytidylyltransferase family protein [Achromobacter sp. ESBL13]|uniref:phosphocholine cytidylyltransferase family protein n=1 Tax=Achromobacter sp. ESBL13 TaxID=3077328 RepID=UPI000EE5CC1B|nr:nucleotidyl transferase [Achromobacter sp.]
MRAIILAAGRGSRMGDMTADQPKCLTKLKGIALLDRQLAALREGGVDEIGIVTGYRREALTDRGLHEFYNPDWSHTNMVSSLACAQPWLLDGPCIVSYSDIFYDAQAVRSLINNGSALALTYDPNWLSLWGARFSDPLSDAETFRLAPDGTLLEIGEKPRTTEEVQGQYMGLLRFTPDSWSALDAMRGALPADARNRMHMTGALQRLIQMGGITIHAVPYTGTWGEVDSQEDLSVYESA